MLIVRAVDCEPRCKQRAQSGALRSFMASLRVKRFYALTGPQLALSGRSADAFPFTQKESRIYAFISAALSQSGVSALLS